MYEYKATVLRTVDSDTIVSPIFAKQPISNLPNIFHSATDLSLNTPGNKMNIYIELGDSAFSRLVYGRSGMQLFSRVVLNSESNRTIPERDAEDCGGEILSRIADIFGIWLDEFPYVHYAKQPSDFRGDYLSFGHLNDERVHSNATGDQAHAQQRDDVLLSSVFGKDRRLADNTSLTNNTLNYNRKQEKYGRYLAKVFLEDGTDVNALLVSQGHAVEKTY